MTHSLAIQLFVPGRVTNVLNGSHRTWHARHDWALTWRQRTAVAWLEAGRPTWAGPARITFTAYVGRLFDDDNLASCCKPIRDEAVKRVLGTDDGPTCGHTFFYGQQVRPHYRGVLVTVEPR